MHFAYCYPSQWWCDFNVSECILRPVQISHEEVKSLVEPLPTTKGSQNSDCRSQQTENILAREGAEGGAGSGFVWCGGWI